MSRIKPYKYVNPNMITTMKVGKKMDTSKGGATIIAAGKKITGPKEEGRGAVSMGRSTLLSFNRIGSAIESLGTVQANFIKTLTSEKKLLTEQAELKRRRQQRERDQAAEDSQEQKGKLKPVREEVKKEVEKKKEGGLLSQLLDKIFGPFKGIIEFALRAMISQGVLRWVANPANGKQIQGFIDTLSSVFNFIFNVAYKSIDFFLSGVSNIFGNGEAQGFDRFKQVMTGLGQVLIGLAGFKALSYLNPFKLIGDLVGLLDFFNRPQPQLPASIPGGTPSTPKTRTPTPDVKAKGPSNKAGDLLDSWKKRFTGGLDNLKSGFMKGWENVKMLGGSISKGVRDKLASSTKWFKEGISKKLTPIAKSAYNLLEKKGIISAAKKAGKTAKDAITNIPGYSKVMKKVSEEGGQAMLKKVGGKAIPVIGGLVNLYFAYDRLKSGDKSGAALEAISAILDLSGLFGFAPGPMISMALDAYLFGRDFFPDVVKKENEFLDKIIGGIMGPLKSIQDSLPKIPQLATGGIVNKPTIAMLGEKGPEAVVPLGGNANASSDVARTLLSSIYGSMDRMGPGGEIAKQLLGGDLSSIKAEMGIGNVESAGGGDSISKTVVKSGKGGKDDDPLAKQFGSKNVVYKKTNSPTNNPNTLRGQLANLLSVWALLTDADFSQVGGGGGSKGGSGGSSGGSGGDAGDIDTAGVEAAKGSVVDKGAAIAKKLMSNLGISKEQAAAIAGNFAHESGGFVPGIREGGPFGRNSKPWPKGTVGKGYGWAQWTNSAPGDRYDKFIQSYGGDYNKIPTNEDNLKFAIQEMKTTNKLSARFKKMTNVADAAVWFRKNWERAGVHHDGPRISYAKGILNKMAKGGKLWDALHGIEPGKKDLQPKNLAKSAPDKQPGKFALGGNYKNGYLPESALAPIRGGGKLRKEVAPQFNKMWDDAKAAGHNLRLNSSYRSYEDQVATYKKYGSPRAAKPGSSPHSWGLAVDLGFSNEAYKWLRANAKRYGFNQIPGLETSNPDGFEAWHWQVGSGRPSGAKVTDPGTSSGGASGSGGDTSGSGGDTSAVDSDANVLAEMQKSFDMLNTQVFNKGNQNVQPAAQQAAPGPSIKPPVTQPSPAVTSNGANLSSASLNTKMTATTQAATDATTMVPVPINNGGSNVTVVGGGTPQVFRPSEPISMLFN